MTSISPLQNVLKKGLYGDYKEKNSDNLIKIKEVKDLLTVQIVQYKNSSLQIKDMNIDGLKFSEEALKVNSNKDSRVLWFGPKNWLFVSNKKLGRRGDNSFKKNMKLLLKNKNFINEKVNLFNDKLISYRLK